MLWIRPAAAIIMTVLSAHAVAAAPTALEADALRAARIGDAISIDRAGYGVTARVRKADATVGGGRVIVADRTDGPGHVVLAVRGEFTAGYITGAGGTWRVERKADGASTFVPAANGFDCAVGQAPEIERPATSASMLGGCDAGDVHDLLVLYDDDVVAGFGGDVATRAEIDAVIAMSNLAFENSETTPRFRLALAWKVNGGTNLSELTDPADGVADEVHLLRDQVAADQVVLLYGTGGGVANGLLSFDPDQEGRAFCRSGIGSFPYVFPHELGHNMGCCHAPGDGGGCGFDGLLFVYSNGHRWFGNGGTEWRTIMAYNPGEQVPHFSNPNVLFDGAATGTPDADNALTMALSRDFVAGFRCSSSAVCGDLSDPVSMNDCNANGLPDGCDIGSGASADVNGDGIPDECSACADLDGDGETGFGDLLRVLAAWGPCDSCPEDLDLSGDVGFTDITSLLSAWGPCS